jgi:hypothetical protein
MRDEAKHSMVNLLHLDDDLVPVDPQIAGWSHPSEFSMQNAKASGALGAAV